MLKILNLFRKTEKTNEEKALENLLCSLHQKSTRYKDLKTKDLVALGVGWYYCQTIFGVSPREVLERPLNLELSSSRIEHATGELDFLEWFVVSYRMPPMNSDKKLTVDLKGYYPDSFFRTNTIEPDDLVIPIYKEDYKTVEAYLKKAPINQGLFV